MFGMLEAMLSFLRRQIGLRTDAADASGSLHAKVTDLATNKVQDIADVIETRQKPRGPASAPGSFTTSETSYQTVLNIAGKGKLLGLQMNSSYCQATEVTVTVDGYAVSTGIGVNTGGVNSYQCPLGHWLFPFSNYVYDIQANGGNARNAEMEFKSSLKIELRNTLGSPSTVRWLYALE